MVQPTLLKLASNKGLIQRYKILKGHWTVYTTKKVTDFFLGVSFGVPHSVVVYE